MKVFISYSHTDRPLARKLASALEKSGLEVWDAKREILLGDNISNPRGNVDPSEEPSGVDPSERSLGVDPSEQPSGGSLASKGDDTNEQEEDSGSDEGLVVAEKVAEGLEESDAMVVLLTPEALASRVVLREIEYALGEKSFNRRLIPVLVGSPEKFPDNSIPWILRRLNMINLSSHGREEEGIQQITQALKEVA